MPIENKEELYALLYEFDDMVSSVQKTLESVDVDKAAEWNLTPKEYGLLFVYRTWLGQLHKCYSEIDMNLAKQMKAEES